MASSEDVERHGPHLKLVFLLQYYNKFNAGGPLCEVNEVDESTDFHVLFVK